MCFSDHLYSSLQVFLPYKFFRFNLRSREGSDAVTIATNNVTMISIHAPAKGATPLIPSTRNIPRNFNPRSREGSDQIPLIQIPQLSYFNPRSREGSDFCRTVRYSGTRYFNPRSREGSDRIVPKEGLASYHISIHAPAKGATFYHPAPP